MPLTDAEREAEELAAVAQLAGACAPAGKSCPINTRPHRAAQPRSKPTSSPARWPSLAERVCQLAEPPSLKTARPAHEFYEGNGGFRYTTKAGKQPLPQPCACHARAVGLKTESKLADMSIKTED
jgi:hypothetical protein